MGHDVAVWVGLYKVQLNMGSLNMCKVVNVIITSGHRQKEQEEIF